jgi:hypothetical protein
VTGRGLFALVIPSPKREDLRRDGRFAMHSFPRDDDEDVFYVAGVARPEPDGATEEEVRRAFLAERPALTAADVAEQEVFRFDIERCLLTRTTGHGDPDPRHTVWRDAGGT